MSAQLSTAVHYRPMMPADLPAVAALEGSVYAFPWSIGNFRDCLEAGYDCWVVAQRGALMGVSIRTCGSAGRAAAGMAQMVAAPVTDARSVRRDRFMRQAPAA